MLGAFHRQGGRYDDDGPRTDTALRLGLVLGGLVRFGAASSMALARAGMDIFGVHLDRKSTQPNAERLVADIKALGRQAHFFNINAADEEKRAEVQFRMERILRERNEMAGSASCCIPWPSAPSSSLSPTHQRGRSAQAQMDMTVDVMAHSPRVLGRRSWSAASHGRGGRIYAMTSAGGAQRAALLRPRSLRAKAALESKHQATRRRARQPRDHANSIRAGVTATPAPRDPQLTRSSRRGGERNPHRRLTTVEDVARAIVVFSHPDTYWMTGNVIGVDGGEEIVASDSCPPGSPSASWHHRGHHGVSFPSRRRPPPPRRELPLLPRSPTSSTSPPVGRRHRRALRLSLRRSASFLTGLGEPATRSYVSKLVLALRHHGGWAD